MKILFLLQEIPFPISNGMRWKMFYLLKYMSDRHQCDVLAFSDDGLDISTLEQMLPNVNWLGTFKRVSGPIRILKGALNLVSGKPASLARYSSSKFRVPFQEALYAKNYDVLHCDIVNMAQYWRVEVATVHSPNDATSLFYSRMADNTKSHLTKWRLKLGAHMLKRYERLAYPRFTKVHVVSKVDAEYLRKNIPSADIVFIPFGVEGRENFCDSASSQPEAAGGAPLVLILGGANVPGVADGIREFVEVVLPRVQRRFPQALFRVQGRDTDKLLQRLSFDGKVNIHSSVWVQDLDALIQKATLIVLPDKAGTGIKTRALQALSCGATIVGTRVAFEGLQDYVKDGIHCAIAENAKELAYKLNELLDDEKKRSSMGRAASALVCSRLAWSELGPEYEAMYFEASRSYVKFPTMENTLNNLMDYTPRISVCIPAYNRASVLPDLLESIFIQEYDDFEVVIVEDNSPERDKIRKVAHEYMDRYPGRIVYTENTENLGYDGNLRRLIEVASGDYVVFMGNDDLMAPGALVKVGSAILRYPDIGVVLRSYASFLKDPKSPVQVFRYFDNEAFFPSGAETIATFFRRCVFISGMVFRRISALNLASDRFDGTLLYQQYLVGEILARENGVYLPQILSFHRLGGTPDFGNSAAEKGLFVPREQTVASSVHFMQGMLSIAKAVENSTGLKVYRPIVKDIGNYAYPILSIQAKRSRREFWVYVKTLSSLGFWQVPMFHVYAFGLLLLRRNLCDRLIEAIKRYLGRTPRIGRIYSGEQ